MLLAKTSPWVAHQQINQGHGQGERLQVEERGVLGWGQHGKAGALGCARLLTPAGLPGRKTSFS